MFTTEEPHEAPEPRREPGSTGFPVEPLRLWRVLVASRKTLLLAAGVATLVGVAAAKTVVPRRFESAAVLRWEAPATSEADKSSERELKTMAASVELPENLAAIRSRLGLNASLGEIGRRLEVKVERDSNLLTLVASAEQPAGALALADVAVDVFLEHQGVAQKKRLGEDLQRLELRVDDARRAVSETRERYDDFRRKNGIMDLPRERELALDHAARLRSEADLARAEARAQEERARSLVRSAKKTTETTVLAEKELRPDLKRIAEARAELAGLEGRLGEGHPKVQALKSEVGTLETRSADAPLVARAERTLGRNPRWDALQSGLAEAGADQAAAQTKEETYVKLAGDAEKVVERLSSVESQAVTLLSRVKVSENHLVESEQLVALARDTLKSPPTSFRIMAPAREPELPAKSFRRAVVVASPLAGLVLAVLFVLGRALRGLRLHSARELGFWARSPVLVSSSWPSDKATLDDLAEDLRVALPQGPCQVVMVGASAYETRLASTLARHLERGSLSEDEKRETLRPELKLLPRGLSAAKVRRAARAADRVVVVVESGRHSIFELRNTLLELGRSDVGFVLVGVGPGLAGTPDRAGDVRAFGRVAPVLDAAR